MLLMGLPIELGACIKVEHLGKRTGRSDQLFVQQSLMDEERLDTRRKPMEAELGSVAVQTMTKPAPQQQGARREPTLIQVGGR